VRTRTTALQIHTRQWIGTYAGKGNGDYRGELASALRAITSYLEHFAFPPNMALIQSSGKDGASLWVQQIVQQSLPEGNPLYWLLGISDQKRHVEKRLIKGQRGANVEPGRAPLAG
jgi:hypothetical protein